MLGAASLIIAKKPDAKELIDKLAPYQGWIGAISAIWGAIGIVLSVLSIAALATVPILWATGLANAVLLLCLGLLLGVGVMKTFVKDEAAVAKLDTTIAKLAPKQGMLGLVAIGVGLWMIVAGFLFTVA